MHAWLEAQLDGRDWLNGEGFGWGDTVEKALATIPFMETLSDLVSSGAFVRHYRDHRLEWMVRSGGLQVVVEGLADHTIRFTDTARFAAPYTAAAAD